ncbi:MAG TPA: hypothetical protein VGO47_02725, partial [Chlamydiales bacterium]|nr:hypothetical protein [Chlamydiales bacterium]
AKVEAYRSGAVLATSEIPLKPPYCYPFYPGYNILLDHPPVAPALMTVKPENPSGLNDLIWALGGSSDFPQAALESTADHVVI